jgi:hypothetical protein
MISRRMALTMAVGAVGALLAGPLVAAPAPGDAAAHDPTTPPSELIGDAVAEYDAGRYEEARALFRAAHEKAPTARTLRGIGMASFELRDYVEAVRALGGALKEQRRALTDEQRRQVEQLLARAETFVGRFALRLQPPDAALAVDDRPTTREADGTLLLPFGHHRVIARCATCLPSEKELEVDVVGGEHRELEISLAAAPVVVVAPNPSGQDGSGTSPLVVDRRQATALGDTAVYWWGGASVAALVGGTAAGLWWGDRAHELDACRAAADRCKNESTLTGQRNLAIGMTVGLGAVAVTTGIIAAVVRGRDARPASTVACDLGRETISCAIRF